MPGYAAPAQLIGQGKHDAREFGTQVIKDPLNNVAIKTEFVKLGSDSTDGGDWVVRISGEPIDVDKPSLVSLVFYGGFNVNEDGSSFQVVVEDEENIQANGFLSSLGPFSIALVRLTLDIGNSRSGFEGKATSAVSGINWSGMSIPGDMVWRMKEIIQQSIVQTAQEMLKDSQQSAAPSQLFQMKNANHDDPNVVIFQHMLSAPFAVEYAYVAHGPSKSKSELGVYFGDSLTHHLQKGEAAFDEKFSKTFQLEEKGFTAKQIEFAQMLIGNMLGGIGYFHGTSIEDHAHVGLDEEQVMDASDASDDEDDYFQSSASPKMDIPPPSPEARGPFTLFTGVPSRPFFPRGFLWDSGFDHHLIEAFDPEIGLDIITHWANLIDENGWLAREQILGDEARSKVPQEFQVQYPHYANPPTLITALDKQVDLVETAKMTVDGFASAEPQLKFLKSVYPKFKRQYEWFHNTQMGQIDEWDYGASIKLGFKWRGRKGKHILTSGMDDYPRSANAHPGDLHVDLLCWVTYFAQSLERVAKVLDYDKDVQRFQKHQQLMAKTLDGELSHVGHAGYVSITPLLLGLIPNDSPKLKDLLDLVHDPAHLWSPYGICSLSKSDPYFGVDENYWRGPIWINVNYLLLQSLHRHYLKSGPYREKARTIYQELRQNLIKNVFEVIQCC
ncbi:Processing alpha glucosidase I [Kappamyces sp. JEL0680]|nr:Processing alpha glucosidase I [Kappamyces sp. JEL0680]